VSSETVQKTIVRWPDVTPVEQIPGLTRRTLSETESAMICEFRSKADVHIPLHSHPHEQLGYVISGHLDITIAGTTYSCDPGDSYAIPGGVEHSAVFPVESTIIDVFSPPREEYR
jgi:quercetin dioxygenase-like cupin family protein